MVQVVGRSAATVQFGGHNPIILLRHKIEIISSLIVVCFNILGLVNGGLTGQTFKLFTLTLVDFSRCLGGYALQQFFIKNNDNINKQRFSLSIVAIKK
jgi:hypothetical protein